MKTEFRYEISCHVNADNLEDARREAKRHIENMLNSNNTSTIEFEKIQGEPYCPSNVGNSWS